MTYTTQAALSMDQDMRLRIAACAATQTIGDKQPTTWADLHQWRLAASPGWDDAYAYALAAGNLHPGSDAAVITDAQILSAVQPLATG